MNKLSLAASVAFGLVMFGGNASAQDQRFAPQTVSSLIDKVHADLNLAYEGRHFSSDDRNRLNHAESELREFAKKWERGKFDKGQLDGSISSIQHVLDNNHMRHEDRDALDTDIAQLRAMREAYDRHELGAWEH